MKRRDVLIAGAAAAAAQTVFTATGCKADATHTKSAAGVATGSVTPQSLTKVLGPCIDAGERCLTHCLQLLSEGNKSLGPCAQRVREMLAVCQATQVLAASESTHLAQAAALCADVCESCRVECAKHAGHHAECRACEQACAATVPVARALAAA